MTNKQLIKVINEEVSNFNFLNLDELNKEENHSSVLNSGDFQKKLIHSLIINDNQNIRDWQNPSNIVAPVENTGFEDEEVIPYIDSEFSFTYIYNGNPYKLELIVEGKKIPIYSKGESFKGNYYQPSESAPLDYTDYSHLDFAFFDSESGERIKMDWFDRDDNLKKKLGYNLYGEMPQ